MPSRSCRACGRSGVKLDLCDACLHRQSEALAAVQHWEALEVAVSRLKQQALIAREEAARKLRLLSGDLVAGRCRYHVMRSRDEIRVLPRPK